MHTLTRRLAQCARILTIAAVATASPFAHAYIAAASFVGYPNTIFVTRNANSAAEADRLVLSFCAGESLKTRDIPKCEVFYRSSDIGWFATACGQAGCAIVTGYKSLKAAQDEAFSYCLEKQKFCNTEMPAYGEEVVGKGKTAKVAK